MGRPFVYFSFSLCLFYSLLSSNQTSASHESREGRQTSSSASEEMASTGPAAEGGAAREERATATAAATRNDGAFELGSADESETALLSTAGALSQRSVPPPPDEIQGPPRRVRVG